MDTHHFSFSCSAKIFSVYFLTSDVIDQDERGEDTGALITQATEITGVHERHGKEIKIRAMFEGTIDRYAS